jgi:AcrR family transcriptional regulator
VSPSAPPNLLAGEDLPAPPRQRRSRAKRARIMATALGSFASLGYAATAIDEIVAAAKVPVGGFYQHFRSKRQLLLALMQEFLDRVAAFELRLDDTPDRVAAMRALLTRAVAVDEPYFGACRAWQDAVLADAELAAMQTRIEAWSSARLTAFFLSLQHLPDARAGVNLPALASTIDRFLWHLLADSVRISRAELQSSIEGAAHLLAHGLFDIGRSTRRAISRRLS